MLLHYFFLILFIYIHTTLSVCIIVILSPYFNMSLTNDDADPNLSTNQWRVDHYRVPKIPRFFSADPGLWFAQVEASLDSANITVEKTKADIVIAELDQDVAVALKDLILAKPRPPNTFELLRKRIISIYAPSEETNLRKLLKDQVITDGKPSMILNRLRVLNDGRCDDVVIR